MSPDEKKTLFRAMLPPLILPGLACALTVPIVILVQMSRQDAYSVQDALNILQYTAMISFAIYFGIIFKKILDLLEGEKTFEIKKIEDKTETTFDVLNRSARGHRRASDYKGKAWIIDGIRYSVPKDIYDSSAVGDEVVFFTSIRSKYRLSFDLRKNTKI